MPFLLGVPWKHKRLKSYVICALRLPGAPIMTTPWRCNNVMTATAAPLTECIGTLPKGRQNRRGVITTDSFAARY